MNGVDHQVKPIVFSYYIEEVLTRWLLPIPNWQLHDLFCYLAILPS